MRIATAFFTGLLPLCLQAGDATVSLRNATQVPFSVSTRAANNEPSVDALIQRANGTLTRAHRLTFPKDRETVIRLDPGATLVFQAVDVKGEGQEATFLLLDGEGKAALGNLNLVLFEDKTGPQAVLAGTFAMPGKAGDAAYRVEEDPCQPGSQVIRAKDCPAGSCCVIF